MYVLKQLQLEDGLRAEDINPILKFIIKFKKCFLVENYTDTTK